MGLRYYLTMGLSMTKNFKFGKTSEARLVEVSDYLAVCARRSLAKSEKTDVTIPWMGGLRTAEEQNELFLNKTSKCDGYIKISFHQKLLNGKGMALDVAPCINGSTMYSDLEGFWEFSEHMFETWYEMQEADEIPDNIELKWGGFYKGYDEDAHKLGWDPAHWEMKIH